MSLFYEIGYLPSDIGVYSPPERIGSVAVEAGIEAAREELLALGLPEESLCDYGGDSMGCSVAVVRNARRAIATRPEVFPSVPQHVVVECQRMLANDELLTNAEQANRSAVLDAAYFGTPLDTSWRQSVARWGTEQQKAQAVNR